jgi:hypothetical protein
MYINIFIAIRNCVQSIKDTIMRLCVHSTHILNCGNLFNGMYRGVGAQG